MTPKYRQIISQGRVLRKLGFERIISYSGVAARCYRLEVHDGAPPWPRRSIWVKLFKDKSIAVSHSVKTTDEARSFKQLTHTEHPETGVELLAAIAYEKRRTDHVEAQPGERGDDAMRRNRLAGARPMWFKSIVPSP